MHDEQTLREEEVSEIKAKGGMATFTKYGVEHYRRMGRLSAEKRKRIKEVLLHSCESGG